MLNLINGHPCCVALLACFFSSSGGLRDSTLVRRRTPSKIAKIGLTFEQNLVFEYMPCTLKSVLKSGALAPGLATSYFFQVRLFLFGASAFVVTALPAALLWPEAHPRAGSMPSR